ncbi:MAG: hypothetical protein SR1Q7_02440 [Quinella sp. 1Q7]|nr:hypothetical protein [Quinella sp. 1Q7]
MKIGTITKRLNDVLQTMNDEYENFCAPFYSSNDFFRKIEQLKNNRQNSVAPSILAELYRMYDAVGIHCERGRELDYYFDLADAADGLNDVAIQQKMIRTLYDNYGKYPSPQDYMARIVDKLSDPQDFRRDDTLRLRILKQFIKYGDYLKDAHFGGQKEIFRYVKEKISRRPTTADILDNLDDGIFDKLTAADKIQKKPDGKFGLIKLADDLATGKFRTGGATKRGLYLFAMVFGMTFGASATADNDIEKNLFRDYYSNNLIRFITDDCRDGAGDYELLPSGAGINYKNFAEMIYLYHIARDYSPQDKIKFSAQMIRDVQSDDTPQESAQAHDTAFYRNFCGEIFDKPPAEFKAFVAENYDCSTRAIDPKSGKPYAIGLMQAQLEQRTAQAVHRELLRKLETLTALDECDYGLWFVEVDKLHENPLRDAPHFKDFCELLNNANRLLKSKRNFDSRNVTRTALLAVYYYWHNEFHNQSELKRWTNFAEHFRAFKDGVNFWLERAFYQPLDTKNFFDIAVVFSSYAYLNL